MSSITETPSDNCVDVGFTSRDFRDAMGHFSTGVVVVSTENDGNCHAMTANAFMSGSLDPCLVMISVDVNAKMHDKIKSSGVYGVSILNQGQQWVSNHFAGKNDPENIPEFDELSGVPVIKGAMIKLAADLYAQYPCGDHTIFVGQVRSLELDGEEKTPLVYFGGRYREVNW